MKTLPKSPPGYYTYGSLLWGTFFPCSAQRKIIFIDTCFSQRSTWHGWPSSCPCLSFRLNFSDLDFINFFFTISISKLLSAIFTIILTIFSHRMETPCFWMTVVLTTVLEWKLGYFLSVGAFVRLRQHRSLGSHGNCRRDGLLTVCLRLDVWNTQRECIVSPRPVIFPPAVSHGPYPTSPKWVSYLSQPTVT